MLQQTNFRHHSITYASRYLLIPTMQGIQLGLLFYLLMQEDTQKQGSIFWSWLEKMLLSQYYVILEEKYLNHIRVNSKKEQGEYK